MSHRLSKAELEYSRAKREILAVCWPVKHLHTHYFGIHIQFSLVSEALKFTFNPTKSLSRASIALVLCALISARTIVHRSVKHISYVDFLSRAPHSPALGDSRRCLLVQPPQVNRWDLIHDIRKYLPPILFALNLRLTRYIKHKFP